MQKCVFADVVTLRTWQYCLLSHSVLEEGASYAYWVPALTSDLVYLAILFPELFGPGRGY